jgi:hypothetical protein
LSIENDSDAKTNQLLALLDQQNERVFLTLAQHLTGQKDNQQVIAELREVK